MRMLFASLVASTFGVVLLEDIGRIATRNGLRVLSSEPQPVMQEPLTTQVRAHLIMRGSYPAIAAFFGDLSDGESLFLVERFQLREGETGNDVLEIWISRLYLKQAGTAAP